MCSRDVDLAPFDSDMFESLRKLGKKDCKHSFQTFPVTQCDVWGWGHFTSITSANIMTINIGLINNPLHGSS